VLRPSDRAPGLLLGEGVELPADAAIGGNVVVHAGTVFGAAHLSGRTEVRGPRAYGDRGNVRAIAATWAIDLGRRLLLDQHGG
jgi:hypothetical protein